MHKSLLASMAAAALLAVVADARADWRKYVYQADGFEVEFPVAPRVAPTPLNDEVRRRLVRATKHMMARSNAQYIVVAMLAKESPNFQQGIERSMAGLKCRAVTSNRAIASPYGPARQIFASECIDGSYLAAVRYFQRGNWFYAILALAKSPKGGDADAAVRFVSSFRMIGPN